MVVTSHAEKHPYQEPEKVFEYFEDRLADDARFEEPGCEMPEELPPYLEAYLIVVTSCGFCWTSSLMRRRSHWTCPN